MKPAQAAGFTLIEAMVAVAIISATVLTIPPMFQWMDRQGVRHAVEQLQADLQLCRVAAIRQRQTCGVGINTPGLNQYYIASVNRHGDLAAYRGNVHFLKQGPDGTSVAKRVSFNCRGMSTTVVPACIFVADGDASAIYRIQVKLPGGISVHLWRDGRWQ